MSLPTLALRAPLLGIVIIAACARPDPVEMASQPVDPCTYDDTSDALCTPPPLTPPMVSAPRVRRNFARLSPAEQAAVTRAIWDLKFVFRSPWDASISYYDQFVLWHLQSYQCQTVDSPFHQNHLANPAVNAMGMGAHMGPTFFPWHRAFLLMFENAMRQAAANDPQIPAQYKNLSLPYWDWGSADSTSAVFSGHPQRGFGLARAAGPQYAPDGGTLPTSWQVTTGRFGTPVTAGANPWPIRFQGPIENNADPVPYLRRAAGLSMLATTAPTAGEIAAAMARPVFDTATMDTNADPAVSFRNYAEGFRLGGPPIQMYCVHTTFDAETNPALSEEVDGFAKTSATLVLEMHNRVHEWVSGRWNSGASVGTMLPTTSPNDPVFFLHHSFVDRLWNDWIAAHPTAAPYLPQPGMVAPSGLPYPAWQYGPAPMPTWERLRNPAESPYQGTEVPGGMVSANAVATLGPYQVMFAGAVPFVRYCASNASGC